MPAKSHHITLSREERLALEKLSGSNHRSEREKKRARILLLCDDTVPHEQGGSRSDAEVAHALKCSPNTVYQLRRRVPERGVVEVVTRAEQGHRKARKLDGTQEAHLVAVVCSTPPDGAARWSLKLIRERLLEMEVVEHIGLETIRTTLKKNELKPWLKQMWCLPPHQDARFVANMEDVLDVYARPYDQNRPVICLDEAAKQLLGEIKEPLPMHSGAPLRCDYEYMRCGTASLFMLFEPLAAKRFVQVRERRTAQDYAQVVKWLCDELYPDAGQIVLVQDNLNTHGPHSLYDAFAPQEAHRLTRRIEWHYTPKHGSWLNMAELELSVLGRQCLQGRIASQTNLEWQVQAWQDRRNRTATRVNWHFTTQDARTKLKHLYPQLLHG